MLLPEVGEVPVEADVSGTILTHQTVAIVIDAFDHEQMCRFFTLRAIGGLHQSWLGRIGKVGRRSGERWIEPSHLRDHAVAVEIPRTILIDGAVPITVDQSTHAAPSPVQRAMVGRDAVGVGQRKNVDRRLIKQSRIFSEHQFANPNRILRPRGMKTIHRGDHEDGGFRVCRREIAGERRDQQRATFPTGAVGVDPNVFRERRRPAVQAGRQRGVVKISIPRRCGLQRDERKQEWNEHLG